MSTNNAAKIREINEILDAGATSVTLPNGQNVSYDLAALRQRRDELMAADSNARTARPVLATVNLSGASA
jgi:predicted aspartyl protease